MTVATATSAKREVKSMNILPAIEKFINSRFYHYALLINGKWGTGKTYYVKEILIPKIKEQEPERDVNYISLYGIKAADEIGQMLCIQAIKDKAGEAGKAVDTKGGQITTVILSALAKVGIQKIGANGVDMGGILQTLPNYNNNVIILDDLEWCSCPINEVLGYVNSFVEHSEASVILVANEEEIGKWQLERNPELQTIIAMNPSMKVKAADTGRELRSSTQRNQVERASFTPEEVEDRRREIFHNNESYRAIKEKVIGLTIDYEPDLKEIFHTLIERSIKFQPHREEVLSQLDWFVETAEKDEHKNIRTFQYFLEKITALFGVIDSQYSALYQVVVRYTYRSSIRYMKGLKMPEWDGDYGQQRFTPEGVYSTECEFGFRFIDEIIVRNAIEHDRVNSVLEQYTRIAERKGALNNDPYQFIRNWYVSEDEEVVKWLSKIEDNIKSGKYSSALFSDIIRHLADIKGHQVMAEKCDEVFSEMVDYIEHEDASLLESPVRQHFILNGQSADIYKQWFNEIDKLINEKKSQSEKEVYEEAVRQRECWATNLVKVSSNKGCVNGHSFVFWLEPSDILARISESTNAELSQFRDALSCFYDTYVYYEHMNDDYEHLVAIQKGVAEMNTSEWGEIKRAYQTWIVNDIGRVLDRLSEEKSI